MAHLCGRADPVARGAPHHLAAMEKPRPGENRMNTVAFRFTSAALLMLATALLLQAHSRGEYSPPREPLSSLPSQIDGWTGTDEPMDQQTLDILGHGEFL